MRMRTGTGVALCLGITLATAAGFSAEQEKRASPHEQVSAIIGGKKLKIEYGRPLKKGRTIFGIAGGGSDPLVPFGAVWRTGADEATVLTTDGDLTIGTVKVPKGTYALFTIPAEKEWTLVINKVAKQWGSFKHDPKQDLGRTPMTVSAAPAPVEQFTIAIEVPGKKSGTLKMSWDSTVASVAIAAP